MRPPSADAKTAAIAAAAALSLLVAAAPAAASRRPTEGQAAAITRAVQTSPVGGMNRVPRNRYVVSHRRISTVEKSWAYARIQPRKRFQSTFQSAYVMLVNPAGIADLGRRRSRVGPGRLRRRPGGRDLRPARR